MLSLRTSVFARAASLAAALCLLAPSHARAQQRPAPAQPDEEEVVRISSELVQTDVMVFDKSGKFVEGLKPEQFELKVDGKARPIVFFDRVRAGTVNEDAQLAAARGVKSAAGGEVLPLDRGRTVVFFVDDLHLSAGSLLRMRKTLLRFIDQEIGQNDVAAVISASGQIGFLQQFTDEKFVLRAAVSRLGARSFDPRDMQMPPMSEAHAVAVERGDPTVLSYFVDAILRENPGMRREVAETQVAMRSRMILTHARSVAVNTLSSLHSIVRNAAPLPGRKVLFFISDGFIVEDRGGELRDWLRRVSDAAARSGVVIYSLDAEGLRTNQPDASVAAGFDASGRLAAVDMAEGTLRQSPLFTLAADTGGRAIVNTNALGNAVAGALKETSLYYLLAWRPESAAEGSRAPKFRRVEVGVRERPDLKVIVRRGFFDAPPEESPDKKKKEKESADDASQQKPASERELQAALRAPLPRAGLPTSLSLGYVNGQNGQGLLTTSVEVERTALVFEQGEKPRATFDAIGVVLDDKGKPVGGFQQQLDVVLLRDAPASTQHVVFSSQVRVPPGLYQVRVATRDTRSGRVGSAMQWVEVPEFKPGKLTMSSIFLGERASAVRPEDLKPEDVARGVLLSVERRFARTSWIRLTTFIYNATSAAGAKPDVALQVQLFRDDQPVFTAPLSKVETEGLSDTSRIPYAAELALASFPAGRYVLQVTAIDRSAKTSASQRTSFVVE